MDQLNRINIYSTNSVKEIIRARMDEFIYAILVVVGVLVATIFMNAGSWSLGLLAAIILYAIIGFGISATAVYRINKFGTQIDHFSASVNQMQEAFISAGGVEKFFFILLAMIWVLIIVIMNLSGVSSLIPEQNWLITIIEIIILLYVARKVIQNLCFIIFYSSVVVGSLKIEYVKYEKKLLSNYSSITDRLTKIKREYIDEVNYLLNKEESKENLKEVKIYQGIIRDLDSILIEILKL